MTFDLDPNRKQNKMRKCSSELKTIEFLGGALTSPLSDHAVTKSIEKTAGFFST